MTSETATECYLYITLPGQTAPVTAGRFTLETDRRDIPQGSFVYGRRYLERSDAVPLDPVELKLSTRVYETTALKGVFGALSDASPDYWVARSLNATPANRNSESWIIYCTRPMTAQERWNRSEPGATSAEADFQPDARSGPASSHR